MQESPFSFSTPPTFRSPGSRFAVYHETPEGSPVGLSNNHSIFKYKEPINYKETITKVIDEELECSVCLLDIDYGTELVCNHKFCYDCVKLMDKNFNKSCPLCRGKFTILEHFMSKKQAKINMKLKDKNEKDKETKDKETKDKEKKTEKSYIIKNHGLTGNPTITFFRNSVYAKDGKRIQTEDEKRIQRENNANKELRKLSLQNEMAKKAWRAKKNKR